MNIGIVCVVGRFNKNCKYDYGIWLLMLIKIYIEDFSFIFKKGIYSVKVRWD